MIESSFSIVEYAYYDDSRLLGTVEITVPHQFKTK